MAEQISLTVNGQLIRVRSGTTVGAAVLNAGEHSRRSVRGEPRSPLCGMGICMECRVTIDGIAQQIACQRLCEPGMVVVTE
ncbi:MAG TPA: (2Fe-2S)-binding protein [Terracidiphilus sp.]|nr:(2Fe-2S)-binding protein [Terracidiphilus sp.]